MRNSRPPPRASARLGALAAAVVLVHSLAACGQKGPLVLPDTDTSTVVIRPAATTSGSPPTAPGAGAATAPASTAPATATPPAAPPKPDDDTPAPKH